MNQGLSHWRKQNERCDHASRARKGLRILHVMRMIQSAALAQVARISAAQTSARTARDQRPRRRPNSPTRASAIASSPSEVVPLASTCTGGKLGGVPPLAQAGGAIAKPSS